MKYQESVNKMKGKANSRAEEEKSAAALASIRQAIDAVDKTILDLLNRRFSLALQTIAYKKNLWDRRREKELIKRLKGRAKTRKFLSPGLIEKIYLLILKESLNQQQSYQKGVRERRQKSRNQKRQAERKRDKNEEKNLQPLEKNRKKSARKGES
jgi:chorismate mutase